MRLSRYSSRWKPTRSAPLHAALLSISYNPDSYKKQQRVGNIVQGEVRKPATVHACVTQIQLIKLSALIILLKRTSENYLSELYS